MSQETILPVNKAVTEFIDYLESLIEKDIALIHLAVGDKAYEINIIKDNSNHLIEFKKINNNPGSVTEKGWYYENHLYNLTNFIQYAFILNANVSVIYKVPLFKIGDPASSILFKIYAFAISKHDRTVYINQLTAKDIYETYKYNSIDDVQEIPKNLIFCGKEDIICSFDV